MQLARSGWTADARVVVEEFLLRKGHQTVADSGGSYLAAADEFVDYVLLDRIGRPIAIVEAKRSSRSALEGERQAADYADRIREIYGIDPFIFLVNGDEIWFWHRKMYPPRRIAGFYRLEDLERLAFQDKYREALGPAAINSSIVDRQYQHEAIRAVTVSVEQAHRRFLLVMATGTGKTRSVIGLIDLLLRCKWISRVLFLADRRELVRQALDAFKEHLPDVPRDRIENGDFDRGARVLVSTYPGMMGVYEKLSTGYFDLIVADESHRSIYQYYRVLFDHFDALQLGLTATPTDFLEHNTFQMFECPDGLPTYDYGYAEAVENKHLVHYRVHRARTRFQIEGIHPGDLPAAAAQQLARQGVAAGDLDFEGTDLEKKVTNSGTNDAIVREFMEQARRDATGSLPGKSVFFCVSHDHALEIYLSFNRLYPDLQRRGFAKVIDSRMERAEKTLDDFKFKDYPRVAISVDMLDTGIDVPSIRTLVFAKPVFSQVKFWQMIGRGTRRWTDPLTDQAKEDFLIIDHWNNFDYFGLNPEGDDLAPAEPLATRLFRLRLRKYELLGTRQRVAAAAETLDELKRLLRLLPDTNLQVQPHLDEIRRRLLLSTWLPVEDDSRRVLSQAIAPLLRFVSVEPWAVLQFRNLCEQLALALLDEDKPERERLRPFLVSNVRLLPTELPEIAAQQELIAWVLSNGFWDHLDYERVQRLQRVLAPLMRFREKETRNLIRLHLPDTIAERSWLVFGPAGEGAFVQTYREQVSAHIQDLAEDHPALKRLRERGHVTDDELDALANQLNRADLFITEDTLRRAFEHPRASLPDFLRHILGVAKLPSREEEIAQAFDAWIARHPKLNATQHMFLRAVRQAAQNRARLTTEDFVKPPFNRIGDANRLFSSEELAELTALAQDWAA